MLVSLYSRGSCRTWDVVGVSEAKRLEEEQRIRESCRPFYWEANKSEEEVRSFNSSLENNLVEVERCKCRTKW